MPDRPAAASGASPVKTALPREVVRLADLPSRHETAFALAPDAGARAAVAAALDISGVRKLTFQGRMMPQGRTDWRLEATLGATVVQSCVVTLEPVQTRIDEAIVRQYLADMPESDGAETEMSDDDTREPLPSTIDLAEVMLEALTLALPEYPRCAGVSDLDLTVTEPGVAPLTADDIKPFAGLAAFKDKLSGQGGGDA